MNATNVVWLLVGAGLGLMISQLTRRSHRPQLTYSEVSYSADTNPPEPSLSETHSVSLQALQEQLHQTELAYSMAAQMSQFKGNFLARTSHELRSPLNAIIGMHQLILSDLADNPEEERDFLTQAHASALKMVKVLDEVIDVSKVEHGTNTLAIQPTPLISLLQSVYSLTHLQAQNRTIRLTIHYPQEESYVAADPRRLRQSLVNLVDGAISHLQEGHIHLSVECHLQEERCYILIHTPLPLEAWLTDTINPNTGVQALNSGSKESLTQLAATPFPSASFIFAVAQSLFQSMQGHLEVKSLKDNPTEGEESSQIRCIIPLVPFEPSID